MIVLELLGYLLLGPLLSLCFLIFTTILLLSSLPFYLSFIITVISIILPRELQTLKIIRQETGKSYITILREKIIYFKRFIELFNCYGRFRQYSLFDYYGRFIKYSWINLRVMVYCGLVLYSFEQNYFKDYFVVDFVVVVLLALLKTCLLSNFEIKQIKQITGYYKAEKTAEKTAEKKQMIFFLMLIRNILRLFSLKSFFISSFSIALLTETISLIATLLIIISVPFDVLIIQICHSNDDSYSIEELRKEFKNLSLKHFRGTFIVLIQELPIIFFSILAVTITGSV